LTRAGSVWGSAKRVLWRIRADNGIVGVKWARFALSEWLGNAVGIAPFATPWVGWRAGIARTV